jgi:four helix bundle protein
MVKTNFEKLRVYQLAEELADRSWKIVVKWDYFAKSTVGMQMVDAVDSVGSNISEGIGRGSLVDNRRFIRIARGSLYETKHWLRRAYKRRLLTPGEVDELKPIINELLPTLNAYYSSVDTAARKPKQSTKHKVLRTQLIPDNARTKKHHQTIRQRLGKRQHKHCR